MSLAHYKIGTASAIVGRGVAVLGGFVSLWLLSRMLTKAELGTYGFAFSVLQLLALAPSLGLDRALLYRLSRSEIGPLPDLVEGGAVQQALWISTGVAILFVALTLALADRIAALSLEGAAFWLRWLSPMMIGIAAASVLSSWFRARGRLAAAVFLPLSPEVARPLLFVLVWAAALGQAAIALAVVLAFLTPIAVGLRLVPRGDWSTPERLARADYAYGGKMVVSRLTNEMGKKLSVLMLGFFGAAAGSGEFLIAAALAIGADIGREALLPAAAPSFARRLKAGDRAGLAAEYDLTRRAGLFASLGAGVFYCLAGSHLLMIFGDYEGALPALLLLWLAFATQVGFGFNSAYLNMSGRAGWTLALGLFQVAAQTGASLALIPAYGAAGAAAGFLVGMIALNLGTTLVIWRLDRFACLSGRAALAMLTAAVVTAPVLTGVAAPWIGALGAFGAMAFLVSRGDPALIREFLFDRRTRK